VEYKNQNKISSEKDKAISDMKAKGEAGENNV
jgi:hypothetical protein